MNIPKLCSMKYDLMKVDSAAVLVHIRTLVSQSNTSPDFMVDLYNKLIDRTHMNMPTIFGYLPAPENSDLIRKVIGYDGYYLKFTTNTWGVDFIWFDAQKKVFMFWGKNNLCTIKAMNSIRWRIHKQMYLTTLPVLATANTAETIDDDEDYSDMPPLIPCDEVYAAALAEKVDYSDMPPLIPCDDSTD